MPEEEQYSYIPPETEQDIFYRTDLMRIQKEMVEDDFVKKKLEDFELWSILSKTFKLTFYGVNDVRIMENQFEAEVCKYLRSIPPCLHNPELYIKIGQARMIFHANLRRGLGTNDRNKINERIAQISQFRQFFTSSPRNEGGVKGFFRRLVGR